MYMLVLLLLAAAAGSQALSPIHAAANANDPAAVRAALADGADVNEIDDDGHVVTHAYVAYASGDVASGSLTRVQCSGCVHSRQYRRHGRAMGLWHPSMLYRRSLLGSNKP